ncbi:M48 family metallopeptidase [Acerihabitans sp. KWT182]|uniref:M48 family metallopeptidase n=1 Tax=Acerihabitans sp. KWT182 TaxID=3157919 RepID=A0AAU7QBZ5_9GAMM
MTELTYLQGYPEHLLAQVRKLVGEQRLEQVLQQRYPQTHGITSDKALYQYIIELKNAYLRNAPPVDKVAWDGKIHVVNNALGLHTAVSRIQGSRLKAKAEIRIATVFKKAPADLLRMIAIHELAHLKEKQHNKAFYQLCCHMEPRYHQLEFDTRLWLTQLALAGASLHSESGHDRIS